MKIVSAVLILTGTGLMLVSAVGVVRLPDVFTRMHAATKGATVGLAFLMVGSAIHLGTASATVKLTLAILFQFATAPVAAHAIGRAAYRAGVPLWEGTIRDDLRDAERR